MKVKELREALGISQNELARRSGVRQATISDIEAEKTTQPWIGTIVKLAAALGCKVEELLEDEEENHREAG